MSLSLLYLFLNLQNFSKDTQSGMSFILCKYHNANLGPLLQTCKCRVQSSSTVIYGSNKYILTKIECWPVFQQDPCTCFVFFNIVILIQLIDGVFRNYVARCTRIQ